MHESPPPQSMHASAHPSDKYPHVWPSPQTALPLQHPKGSGQTWPGIEHGAGMRGNSGQDAPVLDEADDALEEEVDALEVEEDVPPPAPGSPGPSTTTLPPQPTSARDPRSKNEVRMPSTLPRHPCNRGDYNVTSSAAASAAWAPAELP